MKYTKAAVLLSFLSSVYSIPTNIITPLSDSTHGSARASSAFALGRRLATAPNPFKVTIPSGSSVAISGIANADSFTERVTVIHEIAGRTVVFEGAGVDNSMVILDHRGRQTNDTCFTLTEQPFNRTLSLFFQFSIDGRHPFSTAILRPPTGQRVLRFESEASNENEDNETQFLVSFQSGTPGC